MGEDGARRMERSQKRLLGLLMIAVLALALVGCDGSGAATPALPTEAGATQPAASLTPAPTMTAPTVAAPATPTGAAVASDDSATPPIAVDPAATEPAAGLSLTLTDPADGAGVTAGAPLTVRGAAAGGDRVRVVLQQAVSNRVVAQGSTAATGAWLLDITPPIDLVGPLLLNVELQDSAGATLADAAITVSSAPPPEASNAIRITEPAPDSVIVAGRQFSMIGEARFTGETGTVTLRLQADDCTTTVATISFDMVGGGLWEGFMVVPGGVAGPVCAVAIIGAPDSAEARTAYVPLTVAPPDP